MQPPEASNVNLGTPPSRLILVGASVRAAAQSAARAGFQVTGIDLFGDIDTVAACQNYVPLGKSTLSTVTDLHPDSATPVIVAGGLDSHPGLIAALQRRYQAVGPEESEFRRIGAPEFLQQVADAAGVGFPEFRPPSDHSRSSHRWLVKNPGSCGGLAVRWAESSPASCSRRAYLQRWVPGRTFGATFLSDGSSASLLGVCSGRFTKHAGRPFVYAGSLGPVALGEEFTEPMERMGAHVVQQSALKGLFNVDLIIDGEVIWLLEVNPRWSASCELIERAMADAARLSPRESLIGLVFRGRVNDSPLATPLAPYLKRIVFSRQSGRFDLNRIVGLGDWGGELADVPPQGRLIQAGEPVLSVILKYPGNISWKKTRRLFANVQAAVC